MITLKPIRRRELGKPCAGEPPARFDEGEGPVAVYRAGSLSTLLIR